MDPVAPRARVLLVVGGRAVPVGVLDASLGCDLALVDLVLHLRLAAGRVGAAVHLADVAPELDEILALVGVADRVGRDGQASSTGGSPSSAKSSG